jgi:hypothetical protein
VRIFFIFRPNKIRVSSTGVISSLSPPQCRLSFDRRRHAAALCHASFSLNQDELAASASFSGNTLSCRLLSRAEIEALNSQHCRRLPSPDRPTLTLYCYKKIISTLTTHRYIALIVPPHNDTHDDELVDLLSLPE